MRALAFTLLLGLAACNAAPTAGGQAPAPKGVYASAPVSARDLSGDWIIGSKGEPPAGATVACSADQILTLTQTGVRLQGSLNACGGLCTRQEQLDGTNHDGEAQLQGKGMGNLDTNPYDVDYALTYNPKTQHLVGKRLGQPFWAVPLVRASCEPSPTPQP